MASDTTRYKKVLITGASSGIGLSLAHEYLQRGYECLLTGLDSLELAASIQSLRREYSTGSMMQLVIDLSKEGAGQRLFQHCRDLNWMPDVLINNAGFGTFGYISEIPLEREQAMIRLHVLEVYTITRLFLTEMEKSGYGHIINISSISAFQPNALLGTYGATKAFVYQFTRALQYELKLKGSGVRALAICPTPVRTNFGKNTGLVKTKLFNSWMTVASEQVAKAVVTAMERKEEYIIPGRIYHWASKISKRLPERFQMWLSYQHLKPTK